MRENPGEEAVMGRVHAKTGRAREGARRCPNSHILFLLEKVV